MDMKIISNNKNWKPADGDAFMFRKKEKSSFDWQGPVIKVYLGLIPGFEYKDYEISYMNEIGEVRMINDRREYEFQPVQVQITTNEVNEK